MKSPVRSIWSWLERPAISNSSVPVLVRLPAMFSVPGLLPGAMVPALRMSLTIVPAPLSVAPLAMLRPLSVVSVWPLKSIVTVPALTAMVLVSSSRSSATV